jgi:VanZ family protein
VSPKLKLWLPVVIWCLVIFTASTSLFTAENTSRWVVPLLSWMFPGASAASLQAGGFLVRKLAHFTEYGVLFLLLVRGPLRGRAGWAVVICALYAMTDEFHQIFVPLRTPSIYDVALDATGALFTCFLYGGLTELI